VDTRHHAVEQVWYTLNVKVHKYLQRIFNPNIHLHFEAQNESEKISCDEQPTHDRYELPFVAQ